MSSDNHHKMAQGAGLSVNFYWSILFGFLTAKKTSFWILGNEQNFTRLFMMLGFVIELICRVIETVSIHLLVHCSQEVVFVVILFIDKRYSIMLSDEFAV